MIALLLAAAVVPAAEQAAIFHAAGSPHGSAVEVEELREREPTSTSREQLTPFATSMETAARTPWSPRAAQFVTAMPAHTSGC